MARDDESKDDADAGERPLPSIIGRSAKAKSKKILGDLTGDDGLKERATSEYDESIEDLEELEERHGAHRSPMSRPGFENQPSRDT